MTPAIIGAVTLIAERPGISQAELARVIGLERATVGATVARAISAGLVRRHVAPDDARRYVLTLTPRGQKMLAALRRRIATHEAHVSGHLTAAERRQWCGGFCTSWSTGSCPVLRALLKLPFTIGALAIPRRLQRASSGA